MKSDAEIDKLINQLVEQLHERNGASKHPGLSYESGVRYALEWVLGSDEHPLDD